MRLLFILLILVFARDAMACKCATPELNSRELKRYDFIALVKIVKLPATNPVSQNRANGHIRIQVLDLFKGKTTQWAYDDGFNSDCMLYLKEGEQWLFFAYYFKGKLSVDQCTHSVRYADNTGLREWTGADFWKDNGVAWMAKLRALYGRPVISNAKSKVFYANGKLEIEQSIKQNKLDGLRKIYYPNGPLFLIEQFKNGQRVGASDKYSVSGQLLEHVIYSNGLIRSSSVYTDTTETVAMLKQQASLKTSVVLGGDYPLTGKQVAQLLDSLKKTKYWKHPLESTVIYDINGHTKTEKSYQFDGKINFERYVDWRKKAFYEKNYINGRLELEEITDVVKGQRIFFTTDVKGHTERSVNPCNNCYPEFSNINLAAKPPNVYIQ
ncbi:MAG: hypothetical protein V4560_19765 [Bacteroidota bacterium]